MISNEIATKIKNSLAMLIWSVYLITKGIYRNFIQAHKLSPWIRKGVSATLLSGRYTLSYPEAH